MVLEGRKKKKSWFSGILIKKASLGPPSPVSPRTLYHKHPSCVSLEGHSNRGPVLPSEPGPRARSDLRPADGQPPAASFNPEAPAPSATRGPLPGRQSGLRRNWFQLEFLLCTCIFFFFSLQLALHGLGILAGRGRAAEDVTRSAEMQQNGCREGVIRHSVPLGDYTWRNTAASWQLGILRESRFAYPQNQAGWLSDTPLPQKQETCLPHRETMGEGDPHPAGCAQ